MLKDFGALTAGEQQVVAASASILLAGFFLTARHYARGGLSWKERLWLVAACAFVAFIAAGFVVELGRGPTCEDDISQCRKPPAEVRDWDRWWRGWGNDAWEIMTGAGVLGSILGVSIRSVDALRPNP